MINKESVWRYASAGAQELCEPVLTGTVWDKFKDSPNPPVWRTDGSNELLAIDDTVAATRLLEKRIASFSEEIEADDIRAALVLSKFYSLSQTSDYFDNTTLARAQDLHNNEASLFRGSGALDPRGLYIRNAKITGVLDLQRTDLAVPISFENCVFTGGIHLRDAKTSTIHFRNCLAPFIAADRVRTDGVFALMNCFFPYGVNVSGGKFHGDFFVDGSVICAPPVFYEKANAGDKKVCEPLRRWVAARALEVAFNREHKADGVSRWPAQALVFHGEKNQKAFLQSLSVKKGIVDAFWNVYLSALAERKNVIEYREGAVSTVQSIKDWHRYWRAMDEKALNAANITVDQDFNAREAKRTIEKLSSDDGDASPKSETTHFTSAPFCSFGRTALSGGEVKASVRFSGARMLNVWADKNLASRRGEEMRRVTALKLDGLKVGGNLSLNKKFQSYGAVRMTTVDVGASVVCRGGRFHCFNMREPLVTGYSAPDSHEKTFTKRSLIHDIIMRPFVSLLSKSKKQKKITDDKFFYTHAQLGYYEFSKAAEALKIQSSRIRSTLFLKRETNKEEDDVVNDFDDGVLDGYLSLRDTKIGRISDDWAMWPKLGFLILDGCEYEGFSEARTDVAGRARNSLLEHMFRPVLGFFRNLKIPLILPYEDVKLLRWHERLFLWLVFFVFCFVSIPYSIVQVFLNTIRLFKPSTRSKMFSGGRNDRLAWIELRPQWFAHARGNSSSRQATQSRFENNEDTVVREQPYEQLAKVLQKSGLDNEAREVQIRKNIVQLHNNEDFFSRLWQIILWMLATFGYDPWKSAHSLAWLVVSATLVFNIAENSGVMSIRDDEMRAALATSAQSMVSLDPQENSLAALAADYGGVAFQINAPKNQKEIELLSSMSTPTEIEKYVHGYNYPKYYPAVYALDLAIPFLDLDQQDYWGPFTSVDSQAPLNEFCGRGVACFKLLFWDLYIGPWYFHLFEWVVIIMGFIFATMFAAGISGVMKP